MIQQILSVKINSLIQWIILFFTRMFRNRITLNGSAYLAVALFADIRPWQKSAQVKVVCTRLV